MSDVPPEITRYIMTILWFSYISFDDREKFVTSAPAVNRRWRHFFHEIFWKDVWICSTEHWEALRLYAIQSRAIHTVTRSMSVQWKPMEPMSCCVCPHVLRGIHWDFIDFFPNIKTFGIVFYNTGLLGREHDWFWANIVPRWVDTLELIFFRDPLKECAYTDYTKWYNLDITPTKPKIYKLIRNLRLWNDGDESLAWPVYFPRFPNLATLEVDGHLVDPPANLVKPMTVEEFSAIKHPYQLISNAVNAGVITHCLAPMVEEYIKKFDLVLGTLMFYRFFYNHLVPGTIFREEFQDAFVQVYKYELPAPFARAVWRNWQLGRAISFS